MEKGNDGGKVEVRGVTESSEFRAHLEELYERLPVYAERVASVPPEQPYSAEWLGKLGRFWWRARERKGVSRRQVAELTGVPINRLRFFEVGLALPEEVDASFLHSYAEALGQPELYDEFCRRLGEELITSGLGDVGD